MDFENTPQNHTKPPVHNSLPSVRLNPSFPLKVGDKGDVILRLQTALIKSFGTGIFKKFGADGQFGNELDTFLRSKNYSVPLSQADYTTLTQEKKEEIVNANLPLNAFNPTAVAYSIYNALLTKDFLSVITILKGINSSSQYALASEEFKKYRIQGGVRQTIVTALFNSFKTINQKIVIQDTLKKVGLKYDGNKWTL